MIKLPDACLLKQLGPDYNGILTQEGLWGVLSISWAVFLF